MGEFYLSFWLRHYPHDGGTRPCGAQAEAQRPSVVAPAQPSAKARRKASRQRTDQGDPVHSFQTLLADLATIVKNRIAPKIAGVKPFDQTTRPTPLQQRALDLLRVRL
jgi:hypothetical protein